MAGTNQLRKQLWGDRDIGEHARDVQDSFDAIPRLRTKTFEAYYALPMVVGSPIAGEEPESIECTRVVSLVTPEQAIAGAGSHVQFVWKPQNNGCVVTEVQGLTPSTAIKYRFTFRFSYPAKGQR